MTTVEPFTQQDVALLNARHFTLQTPAVQTPGVHDTGVYNTGAAVSPGGQVTVTRARAGYLLNLGGIQENTVHMGLVDAMNLAER